MECKLNIQNMQKYAIFAKYAVAPAAFICKNMQELEYASYVSMKFICKNAQICIPPSLLSLGSVAL